MPQKFVIQNFRKLRKAVPVVESKVKVKINLVKGSVLIEGSEYNEYIAGMVLRAVDFGFDVEDALLLLNEDFTLRFVNIKEHTPRKNLVEVRARLIGTDGRAKRTIEELTGGVVVVSGNTVGLIIDSEHLTQAIQGIQSLIHGSKHGNVFSYLEKQNAELRNYDEEDLGLKESMKKFDIE